jgi:hypothetical protein
VSHRIDYCGEGPVDGVLARRLIAHVGAMPGIDYITPRKSRGVRTLDPRLPGLRIAAQHGRRILVLRDLDQDERCAGALMARLQPKPQQRFCLRIAVRAAEAWLLADRDGIASALGISKRLVPRLPEQLDSPKLSLAEIASQSSKADVRRAFAGGVQARSAWVAAFISDKWSIAGALNSRAAPSLNKAVIRVRSLAQ